MLPDVQNAVDRQPAGTTLLLLCDFDGTLAEFDPDPAAPVLSPARRAWLEQVARRPHVAVGIVSGRRLDDLQTRTGLPSAIYHAGLHGLEIEVDGRRTDHPDLAMARGLVAGLASALTSVAADWPGVFVEDKSASVAIHARRVARAQHDAIFARADGVAAPWLSQGRVRRLEGNAVVEYLPGIAGHKGDALRWIKADVEARRGQPAWVVYVGDDITDEDAFRAIDSGIGVLVGLRPTAATHKLDGIPDVDRFLSWLSARE
jgi:trehalose 6-phosphate phosphatase